MSRQQPKEVKDLLAAITSIVEVVGKIKNGIDALKALANQSKTIVINKN